MAIKTKITRAMAKVGAGTPAPATQGFYLYDTTDVIAVDTQTSRILPLRGAFTKTPSLIGRQLYRFTGKTFTDKHSTGESVRWDPLLVCSAMSRSIGASSITYTPIAQSFSGSSIYVDLNGVEYVLDPSYGTFTMAGSAGQGVECNFDIQAPYVIPVATTSFGSFSPGTSVIETFKGVSVDIVVAGGGTYSCADGMVFKGFNFNRGAELGERLSACAASGTAGLDFSDALPTLELTLEMPLLNTDLGNYYDHLTDATLHGVTIKWGSVANGIWRLTVPKAQITNITTPDGDAGNRNLVISYECTHDTDNAEFKIEVDDTL